ncbi:PAS domain S-box protein [Halorubrum kocurii]|uniref:PAS/PAC sensor signal transduction histidine kinase n=1 Tax=Halorubrum kocurii JCM 14978 TaxID=1230456 RepID=M0P6D4_9EURY|nr:PAS domain S-box protein [Halorubrum kocurii]EMA65079.1 PAS/PAC sensor signal transduction histidine kinase [Halorubrum kocurii JCM 14978]
MSRGNGDEETTPPAGEFFASVVEEHTDPIVSVDGGGEIVYVNPAAEAALGRDAASLVDRRLAELIPDATAERRGASLRELLGAPARLVDAGDVPIPLAAAGGETRVFSARFHAHESGGETAYTGVFRDGGQPAGDRERKPFRNLVEHAGHAVYVTDTSGTIQYVNPAFTEHTGYEPSDAIGETPAILKSGEMSDEYYESLWETLRAGDVWEEEIVDQRKDGSYYHAHQTIAPVTDERGTISRFIAIQIDISDRKAAMGRLKQYRDIVEQIDDPVLLQDLDGEMELLNDAVCEFAGMRREALYGADESAFMDDETAAEIEAHRRSVLETETAAEYEVAPTFPRTGREPRFSTQRYPYYDGDGELAGTFAVCRDVTEIKLREAELERYERAVDGATDLIAAVDREGRFLFANRQYRAYHGIDTAAEISELTLEDILDDGQYADVRHHVDRALEGRNVEYRTTRVHSDRGKRTLDVRYYPLVNPVEDDGGFAGVVGVLRDVTDSESRARQLRVVDRVLQHNLRNALTVIRGRAEQIAERDAARTGSGGARTGSDAETSGEVADAASDIVTRANALLSTSEKSHHITEILGDAAEREPIDVGRVVEHLGSVVEAEYPAAELSISTPDDVAALASVTTWIDRALGELIRNAVEHHDRDRPVVEVTVEAKPGAIEVRVADDGPGLTDMDRDVLETGQAVEALYHGSGLGLWLVYWVVQQSGGSATARDADPRGTVVTLTLPRAVR